MEISSIDEDYVDSHFQSPFPDENLLKNRIQKVVSSVCKLDKNEEGSGRQVGTIPHWLPHAVEHSFHYHRREEELRSEDEIRQQEVTERQQEIEKQQRIADERAQAMYDDTRQIADVRIQTDRNRYVKGRVNPD